MFDDFYVYAYLDTRKPGQFQYGSYFFEYEPFYIGKGRSKRQFAHLKKHKNINDKNKLKVNKIKKIKSGGFEPVIIKIKENLNEEECFSLEKKLIAEIGRFDLKKGPLVNLTNGGEGSSGRVCNQYTKEKIGKANTGKKHTSEWKELHSKAMSGKGNPMYGKSAVRGKKKSPETIKRMSEGFRKLSKSFGTIGCFSHENDLLKTYSYRYELADAGFNSPGKILKTANKNKKDNKKRSMYGFIWIYMEVCRLKIT